MSGVFLNSRKTHKTVLESFMLMLGGGVEGDCWNSGKSRQGYMLHHAGCAICVVRRPLAILVRNFSTPILSIIIPACRPLNITRGMQDFEQPKAKVHSAPCCLKRALIHSSISPI